MTTVPNTIPIASQFHYTLNSIYSDSSFMELSYWSQMVKIAKR